MAGNKRSGRYSLYKHHGDKPKPPEGGWQRAYTDSKNPAYDHLKSKLNSGKIKSTDQPHLVYNNDEAFHCMAPSKFPTWFKKVVSEDCESNSADTRTISRAPSASNRSSSLATSTTTVSSGPSPRPPTNVFKMSYNSSDDDSATAPDPDISRLVRCELGPDGVPTHVTPLLSGDKQHNGGATMIMNESYVDPRADGKGVTIRIVPSVGQTAAESAVLISKDDPSVVMLASAKGDRTDPRKIEAVYTKGKHEAVSGKGKKKKAQTLKLSKQDPTVTAAKNTTEKLYGAKSTAKGGCTVQSWKLSKRIKKDVASYKSTGDVVFPGKYDIQPREEYKEGQRWLVINLDYEDEDKEVLNLDESDSEESASDEEE